MDTDKLIDKCFNEKIIFRNLFITVKKRFKRIAFELDFKYLLKFEYMQENYSRRPVLYLFGQAVKLWKIKS